MVIKAFEFERVLALANTVALRKALSLEFPGEQGGLVEYLALVLGFGLDCGGSSCLLASQVTRRGS